MRLRERPILKLIPPFFGYELVLIRFVKFFLRFKDLLEF